MSEGELKKRFGALFYDNLTGKVHSGKDFFDVLDEARKEFPLNERLRQTIEMAEKELDFKAHGFSSRLILKVLEETLEAKKKWFGSPEKK
jgi:hypothetical protein